MDFGDFLLTDRPATRRARDVMPRAALFDLDGTLIDSVPDITLAVGELMEANGLPAFGENQVREMVGHGLRPLVRRAFEAHGQMLDADAFERQIVRMSEIYPRHLTGRTRPMPFAGEALDMLEQGGTMLALVTNKLQSAANSVLGHFGWSDRFRVILGDQARPSGLAPKPAPDMLQFTLTRLATHPLDAIMIGDSGADIAAARAAGVFSVALRNGYSNVPIETLNPDVVIDTLADMDVALDAWRRR